jgi:hypothetical protein
MLQKSVKKIILETTDLSQNELKKMHKISQPNTPNEKLKKIIAKPCNIIKTKEQPVELYKNLIQNAEIKDRFSVNNGSSIRESFQTEDQLNFSNLIKNSIQFDNPPEDLQETDLHFESVKKSVFSNHHSVKKSPHKNREMEVGSQRMNQFEFKNSANRSEVRMSSVQSKMSGRSRNSSCYKIVKKELDASAKMSQKNSARLSHDLRAFKVKAEPINPYQTTEVQNDFVDFSDINQSMLRTAPIMNNIQLERSDKKQYFFSPSKSERDVFGRKLGQKFVNLKSRSNSHKKNTVPLSHSVMREQQASSFNQNPFLTNHFDQEIPHSQLFNISPEKQEEEKSSFQVEKRFKTTVPRNNEEEDPEILINELESGIEELKKLKKRTASHTPTRNQRMIYRQIIDVVCPEEKKKKKKRFKSRVDTGLRRNQKKRAARTPNLRKNYSKQVSEMLNQTKRKKKSNKENPNKTGLSKYCSMKYAALQLKNQQNMLENILQKCHNKFKQIDSNIESLKEAEIKYQSKTPGKKKSIRDSKYYSNFVKDLTLSQKKSSVMLNKKKKKKTVNGKKKSYISRATASTMKMNRIFRDLNKAIKFGKKTGVSSKNYRTSRLV